MSNQPRIVRGYGLIEHLREHKDRTSYLLAYDGDGAETRINVPDVRNRHARVLVTLRELAWVRVDLYDKKGGLVYRHQRNQDDRDAPAGEMEDLAPTTRAASELQGYLKLMLNAQDVALSRQERSMSMASAG